MKKEEFQAAKKAYEDANARMEAIKIGDIVYEEVPRGYDNEYFEIKVTGINIEERSITGNDLSQSGKEVELVHFWTKDELKARGINFTEKS